MKVNKSSIAIIITVVVLFLGSLFMFRVMKYGGWVQYTNRYSINELPQDFRGKLKIFILMGQSNMSGEGTLPSEPITSPKIWVFGNDYEWKIASEPMDDNFNQIDMVSWDSNPAYSLSTSFARTYRENHKEMIIGLVPCALGASSITDWQRNMGTDFLYGSCLKRAKIAGLAGQIQGVLIFQGEAEANSPVIDSPRNPIIDNYGVLFEKLILDFRSDIGIYNLPVVYAQVSPSPGAEPNKNWKAIQQIQASIELDCVAMVNTSDLPQQDGLHLTRDSLDDAGERFANEMWKIVTASECPP